MEAVKGVKPWCGQYQLESIGKYWVSLFRPIRFTYYHSISLYTISTLGGNGPPSKNTDTEIHNRIPPGVQKHAFNSVYTQSQGRRPASVHLASAQTLPPSDSRKKVSGDTHESTEMFNRPDACWVPDKTGMLSFPHPWINEEEASPETVVPESKVLKPSVCYCSKRLGAY